MTSRRMVWLGRGPCSGRAVPAHTVASCRFLVARCETEDELLRRLIDPLRGIQWDISDYYVQDTSSEGTYIHNCYYHLDNILSFILFLFILHFCCSSRPLSRSSHRFGRAIAKPHIIRRVSLSPHFLRLLSSLLVSSLHRTSPPRSFASNLTLFFAHFYAFHSF
jgi:hypothetical protein